MSDRVEKRRATHFRLGEVDGPVLRGSQSELHDFAFPVGLRRRGAPDEASARISVRFRGAQISGRAEEQVRSLARWIAEGRLHDHLAKVVKPPETPFEATDEEVGEFFREVDATKVAVHRDQWLEVHPQHGKVGF